MPKFVALLTTSGKGYRGTGAVGPKGSAGPRDKFLEKTGRESTPLRRVLLGGSEARPCAVGASIIWPIVLALSIEFLNYIHNSKIHRDRTFTSKAHFRAMPWEGYVMTILYQACVRTPRGYDGEGYDTEMLGPPRPTVDEALAEAMEELKRATAEPSFAPAGPSAETSFSVTIRAFLKGGLWDRR